jgi:uncharacterized repeat protein (TIGR01451 family)
MQQAPHAHRFFHIGLFVACLLAGAPAAAQGVREYLYVTNWGSHDVSGYVKDPATGALAPVPGSPFATAGEAPRSIAMDPSSRFLYVANEFSSSISAFRIDAATGALTTVPGSPFGGVADPQWLQVDVNGRFLFVADPALEKIKGYRIEATTGALTLLPGNGVPVANNVFGLGTTPSGRFLYASTRNPTSEIYGFALDPSSGALTPLAGSPWLVGRNAQAFEIVVDPTERFLYTGGLEANAIFGFSIDSTSGALTPLAGPPVPTVSYPQFLEQTPNGAFLYASATVGGNLAGYSIASATGALVPLPGFPIATGPISMDVVADPSGVLLYLVSQGSSTVRGFSLNPSTGGLVPLPSAPVATGLFPNRMAGTRFGAAAAADLSIAKTDGLAAAVPGAAHAYAITVANHGPGSVTAVTVIDAVPAALLAPTFTPSAGAYDPGTGAWTGLALAPGQSVTLTLNATIAASATGTLVNTATVATPAGVVDPAPVNNSATDTDVLTPRADLGVTKSDGETRVEPGQVLLYSVTVFNAGPSLAPSSPVVDAFPAALTDVTWACSGAGGATCSSASGAGDIDETVTLPPGGSATFAAQATVAPAASGLFTNTATVAAPSGVVDPLATNNASSDTDNVTLDLAELTHGYDRLRSLVPLPGPLPRTDQFWIAQAPHSSYEALVDATSGDLGAGAGPLVERVEGDGSTVLQGATAVGVGHSRSLRWANASSSAVEHEFVRIRSAVCTTDCGADDVYRLRFRETTYAGARFNNGGTQSSVVLVQNRAIAPVALTVYFWSEAGTLLAEASFGLEARQTLVLPASAVPGTAGQSGSVTIAHDGGYGDLAGKVVSLEPSTGFGFDTPLLPRTR